MTIALDPPSPVRLLPDGKPMQYPVHVPANAAQQRCILALRSAGEFTDREVGVFGGGDTHTIACRTEAIAAVVRDRIAPLA